MATKRVAARAGAASEDAPLRGKAGRHNRKAENRFSHGDGGPPTTPRKPRAHPSLQSELLLRGITIAELAERAQNFDNNVTMTDADRLASAVIAYMNKLTAKNRRVQWCVIPGFVFDSRTSPATALIADGWAGYAWTYKPEEYVAASAEFEQLEAKARMRLLDETKAYPRVHSQVKAMGNSWEPKSDKEKEARELVTEWLLTRVTANRQST